jgi:hypothetical protein
MLEYSTSVGLARRYFRGMWWNQDCDAKSIGFFATQLFFYDSCNFGVLEIRTARSMLLLIRKINKFCASFLLFMVQSISN